MRSKNLLPQILVVAVGLFILGGLGAYWPQLVGADSPDPVLALAIIDDAITYQGYLTDENDTPLDGTFTMRFRIYNAPSGGTALWNSGNMSVPVNKGLFEVKLAITTDIFNGEELWLLPTINGENLTPRQEILPAPMAHTLRPGAIIKGTANAISNNYLLEVDMNNDAFGFNRGAITGKTTTGNAIYGLANNGRAIYGQTQDGYAVYGFDGGSNANRGYAGYFYSTNGIGVYGYSNGNRTHPNTFAPGVYGQSNQGVGIYGRGDTSNSYSWNNEGGYFEGGRGLYARGTDAEFEGGSSHSGYGARFYSTNYRALYALGDSDDYDAHFDGGVGIIVDGSVAFTGGNNLLVFNGGKTAIESGDLVAMVGVATAPATGNPMLAVAKVDASNGHGVIGVATGAFSADLLTHENGRQTNNFTEAGSKSNPNSYLGIITNGLAPAVNLHSLANITSWQVGDKIVVSSTGEMGLMSNETDGIVIGKVAGQIDEETGTVPLFINID